MTASTYPQPGTVAPDFTVGTLARERGAELPHRLVSSAKSWLSQSSVDRSAPILPWQGADAEEEDDTRRVSPVNASARYLAHLRAAWDDVHPDAPLDEQEVLLTVPASFDASARELRRLLEHVEGITPLLARYLGSLPSSGSATGRSADLRFAPRERSLGDCALRRRRVSG